MKFGFDKWVIVFTVVSAALLQMIDTSIVNVTLIQMMGNLGASLGDISWVVTGYAAANAVWPSFYAELFSTKVRFSGLAIGTQLGFLMAGFAPAIVAAMGGIKPGGWVQISIFTAIICAVAAASALTAKESFRTPTKELGLK